MLTKTQLTEAIEGLQEALGDNVRAIISAKRSGLTGVHRIISQAPALSFTLTALSQLQDLLVEMEDAEAVAEEGQETAEQEVVVEDPFAKRMREAREKKAAQRDARRRGR
jgi:NACalpha-BTF3-like transcription factor